MDMDNIEKIEIIMETYSFEQQREMFVEECAEAIQAVQKLKRSDHTNYIERTDNLREEVADVLIMAEQMRRYVGADKVDEIISEKLDRQIKRIEVERYEAY